MKAPEKIYIADGEGCAFSTSDSEIAWCYKPAFDCIEYTRTDAFIEKATKWFLNNAATYFGHGCVYLKDLVEDFKNAIR